MSTFGERLRVALEVEKIKPAELARELSRSRQTISNYMMDRSFPDAQFFIDIKRIFPKLSLDWLIANVGEQYIGDSELGTEKEKKLQHEIEDLKSTQAQLLKAVSALSSVIPSQAPKDSGRSFKPGVRETGRRIVNLIEKYTAAHTPLVAEVATA